MLVLVGYVKLENSRNVCEAKCTNGCSNGKCVGPERCECLPGYFATTSGKRNATIVEFYELTNLYCSNQLQEVDLYAVLQEQMRQRVLYQAERLPVHCGISIRGKQHQRVRTDLR